MRTVKTEQITAETTRKQVLLQSIATNEQDMGILSNYQKIIFGSIEKLSKVK